VLGEERVYVWWLAYERLHLLYFLNKDFWAWPVTLYLVALAVHKYRFVAPDSHKKWVLITEMETWDELDERRNAPGMSNAVY